MLKKDKHYFVLAMVEPGQIVQFVRADAGCALQARLAALGMVAGVDLEVIRKDGPFVVALKGGRIVLGRGMADKIVVEKPSVAEPTREDSAKDS